jgi:hypothetical protein
VAGGSWHFNGASPVAARSFALRNQIGIQHTTDAGLGDLNAFLDFLRLRTESLLREIDCLIKMMVDNQASQPGSQGKSQNSSLEWGRRLVAFPANASGKPQVLNSILA